VYALECVYQQLLLKPPTPSNELDEDGVCRRFFLL